MMERNEDCRGRKKRNKGGRREGAGVDRKKRGMERRELERDGKNGKDKLKGEMQGDVEAKECEGELRER